MLACFIIALQLSQASSVASINVACRYLGAFATGFNLIVTPHTDPGKGTRKYELIDNQCHHSITGRKEHTYHIVVRVSAQWPHLIRPQSPPCFTASTKMGASGNRPKRSCIYFSRMRRASSLSLAWGSDVDTQNDCWEDRDLDGILTTLILAVVGTHVPGNRSFHIV